MADALSKILETMYEWNWVEMVKGGVSIWVAIVATLALKTWKRQSKAQKQVDFLDEITNSVHEFIATMSAPIEMLKYIKIAIESYMSVPSLILKIENPAIENAGAVAYIQKGGKEDSKRLIEHLNLCAPSLAKVRSLLAKGQVLGFKNYTECQNACTVLAWQHDRIGALCFVLGSPSLNWEHPEVQKSLNQLIQVNPEEIQEELKVHNVRFLVFVKENYEKIYH